MATPDDPPLGDPLPGDRFTIPLDGGVDAAFKALTARVQGLAEQGTHVKVRLSYKGRRLGRDLPIGAVLAGEVASALLMGPLRVLITNLSVGTVMDVELVYETTPLVKEAMASIKDGHLDAAEGQLREALVRWPADASAWLHLGRVFQKTGRADEAEQAYRKAMSNEAHPAFAKAQEALSSLRKGTWR